MDQFDADFDDTTEVVQVLSPGSYFGDRFRIEEPIGYGATSAVFRATDLQTDKAVALKVLMCAAGEKELRARFQREQKILHSISHPSIVQIFGFGTEGSDQEHPWFALELLEGETLAEHIKKRGAMPLREVVEIATQIASALEAAHKRGVVHRDVKPANIVLTNGRVKLIDFGLSLIKDASKLTAKGHVVGTPRYMSPEIIASVRGAGPAADTYALAVTCYEMLSGSSPFSASDHGQLLGAILSGRRVPLSVKRPDLSSKVGEALDRALLVDPDERTESPLALARELTNTVSTPPPPPVRFRKLFVLAGVAVLLMLIFAALLVLLLR